MTSYTKLTRLTPHKSYSPEIYVNNLMPDTGVTHGFYQDDPLEFGGHYTNNTQTTIDKSFNNMDTWLKARKLLDKFDNEYLKNNIRKYHYSNIW